MTSADIKFGAFTAVIALIVYLTARIVFVRISRIYISRVGSRVCVLRLRIRLNRLRNRIRSNRIGGFCGLFCRILR